MRKIRIRTLFKICSRAERAVRRRLVEAAGRRESPDEFYNLRDAKNAIEWRIRLPRSFRRKAEECAYVGGRKNRNKNNPIDPTYVHPKKIVKVRLCGYWQILAEPKEAV